MISYKLLMTKQAKADRDKVKKVPALRKKVEQLLELIIENPYSSPPSYEKLSGDLNGAYSRRLNKQHRLVYTVNESTKEITILRMWTHYE